MCMIILKIVVVRNWMTNCFSGKSFEKQLRQLVTVAIFFLFFFSSSANINPENWSDAITSRAWAGSGTGEVSLAARRKLIRPHPPWEIEKCWFMGFVERGILRGSVCVSTLLFKGSECLNFVKLNGNDSGETGKLLANQQISGSLLLKKF